MKEIAMERKPLHDHAKRSLDEFLQQLRDAQGDAREMPNRDAWVHTWCGMCRMLNGVELPKNHDEIRGLVLNVGGALGTDDTELLAFIDNEKRLALEKMKKVPG
ncbi:MAG: hypothetical protein WA021_00365 [Minisyncoccia bacterium]